ncbi:MAG TPA: two-component regulator propeller domain-containing protein [Flavobacteriales bacterium]|nr:two-component regulator propeller domain-containing protein [Flavobacteriales bacterium]
MRSVLRIGCAVLLLAACDQDADVPSSTSASRIVEARGRVTPINSSNAPDTVALFPEVLLPAPRFTPTDPANAGAMAHMRTYTTDDGLPMDDIMCGTLDRNGMLWFGTNGGGITRYDGRSFTNYSTADGLPDNVILSLLSDSQGNLWIGTSTGGLSKYDGRSFRTVELNDATGLAKGVRSIVEDGTGNIWFGTRGRGLYKYDGSSFTNYTADDGLGGDHIRKIAPAQDGTLWVSTLHGVARFADGRFTAYTKSNDRSLAGVEGIVSTDDRTVWLGHAKGGVTRCTVAEGEPLFTDYPVVSELNLELAVILLATVQPLN